MLSKMIALLALLPGLALLVNSSPIVGSQSYDVYPPTKTSAPNTALFPNESEVGYYGTTITGAEPMAFQTAPAQLFPKVQDEFGPLVIPEASDNAQFSVITHWGNQGPRYSLPADTFGLANATPIAPDHCSLTQVHLLFRHGSRYPSAGEPPILFAQRINTAATNGTFKGVGALEFINDWQYTLGQDILNVFGRQQCYELGVRSRMAYGHLLNNFTEANALPVFRTGSQDRMVETLEAFGQGFFGRRSEEQFNMVIEIEGAGFNDTESPANNCANFAKDAAGGGAAIAKFVPIAFNSTAQRLAPMVSGGYKLTATDVLAMLDLCSYETISLGYSKFCSLFTEEEFKNFEYYFDLEFYYGYGPGANTAAALGKGWVEELVSRLTKTPITVFDSTTNKTLDNSTYMPLNQSIYADATHDAYMSMIYTALNLTEVDKYGSLPLTSRPQSQSYVAGKIVPFNSNFVVQVMSCANTTEPQLRFIINDAVVRLDQTYTGCTWNADGLCPVSQAVDGINERLSEIDYSYACHGNWTYPTTPRDLNGLPV